MLYREISRVLGQYFFFFSFLFLIPSAVAAYYEFLHPELHPQPHSTAAFLLSFIIAFSVHGLFRFLGRKAKGVLYRREALAMVVGIWFLTAIAAGMPFYFSQTLSDPVDCYFEAISGLTTTGASVFHPKNIDPLTGQELAYKKFVYWGGGTPYFVLGTVAPVLDPQSGEVLYSGVEAVGKAILFWRSFLQWLGGMGIVVLFIAVLPALGIGGKFLYQVEVPGPAKDAVTPRIKETASILWKLYLGFSVLEVFLLMYCNAEMPLFDAVCITFSNLSTGGFAIKNASIGSYNHAGTEWIVCLFMFLGSVNFALYFHCLRGRIYRLYEPEFMVYLGSLMLGAIIFVYYLSDWKVKLLDGGVAGDSFLDILRISLFHLLSAQTSTGFVVADFNFWPGVVQVTMLLVMFTGSMSGSTGGGIKIARHYMLFHVAKNRVESIFNPRAVRSLRIGDREINTEVESLVLTFFFIVVSLSALSTFLYVLDGLDPETALSVTACMINNIGIGFRAAGPTESFAFLSSFGKILSSILMVMGRLEFFALLIVLIPAFWSSK